MFLCSGSVLSMTHLGDLYLLKDLKGDVYKRLHSYLTVLALLYKIGPFEPFATQDLSPFMVPFRCLNVPRPQTLSSCLCF